MVILQLFIKTNTICQTFIIILLVHMLYIYDLHVQILRYFPINPYNAYFQELNNQDIFTLISKNILHLCTLRLAGCGC